MSDMRLLQYWDGSIEHFEDPPQKTFVDEDGDWVALWWWPAQEWVWDGKKNNLQVLDVIAGVARVVFTPESFIVERYEDEREFMEGSDLEEDEIPEWGEGYRTEAVEFPRDVFAEFLKDVILGRLVYERFEKSVVRAVWTGRGNETELRPVTEYYHRWVPAKKRSFHSKKKLPRTREELATWVHAAGSAALSAGGCCDGFVYELPEGVPESP